MNQYRNTDKDIHTRIYTFVVGCFGSVVRKIPKNPENPPIISQVSSSLTSMGANDREADAASSRRDFLSKYTIVRKETRETHYWLCLIRDTGILSASIMDQYIQECEEIGKIVSKIIENTRR
ncbi:four helix bundle protein [Candidatus Gottesmanbacteria bacterium]|nr:four helix bundle protein [Candidatus Gottesmanbacteria bacterium]